jgi:hypothetical protein
MGPATAKPTILRTLHGSLVKNRSLAECRDDSKNERVTHDERCVALALHGTLRDFTQRGTISVGRT